MPTRNVNLTHDLDDFVLTRVESGRYANASELVQDALRALHREERTREAKSATSAAATDEGIANSIAEADILQKLWQAHQVQPQADQQ